MCSAVHSAVASPASRALTVVALLYAVLMLHVTPVWAFATSLRLPRGGRSSVRGAAAALSSSGSGSGSSRSRGRAFGPQAQSSCPCRGTRTEQRMSVSTLVRPPTATKPFTPPPAEGRHQQRQVRHKSSTTSSSSGSKVGKRARPGSRTKTAVSQVVFLRHGLSTFNSKNMFTGWADVPLTEAGEREALEAGKLLAMSGFGIDVAHTSVLSRAGTSLHRVLEGCGQPYVPIKTSWKLNERHYGSLQGMNKARALTEMGPQISEIRRGACSRPPPMGEGHPHYRLLHRDPRYRHVDIPDSESLDDTAKRVLSYWEDEILPDVRAGKNVLVVGHANTLRALIRELDGVDGESIKDVKIPTGRPFMYRLDANSEPCGQRSQTGTRCVYLDDLLLPDPPLSSWIKDWERQTQHCGGSQWYEDADATAEECFIPDDDDNDDIESRLGKLKASQWMLSQRGPGAGAGVRGGEEARVDAAGEDKWLTAATPSCDGDEGAGGRNNS